ncbi:alpha/beta fold hydrolase [Mycolicibacterium rhodesiae]|uniref:Alpha/beta hydrolase n=1 Tax=Mycolicibacterium rhodesiae TaxID=36814 RepID=A0A1X0IQ29_MYCRH|nr:alpha/beta hydrolase [Mycolicibacterium rhodesiae]MCV7344286.1 alpha/beta hydrolase [Mycolicibacterium rhodesiae]ORB50154.1 alpha/beta hydrolase [Mycolicibacterium rhodesiae]
MTEPRWIDVSAPAVQLRALSWGPDDGPIALCLHGFPDTAYGFRKLAPYLVAAGYRVVAPFMRGYVPSSLPADGSQHIGAVMDDALRVLAACNPTGADVVIGHDWGAIAATGLAAMPDSPFTKAVVMSVPPSAALRPGAGRKLANRGRLLRLLPVQLLRSWYISYFQLPFAPERSSSWIVPLLWRRWSPGYNAAEDLRHVDAAIGTPDRWRAALGTYRATIRNTRPPSRYAELNRLWLEVPRLPTLYLHGADDGCMTAEFTPWVAAVLPAGSEVAIVEHAGHFLQLEQPEVVGGQIVAFLSATSS